LFDYRRSRNEDNMPVQPPADPIGELGETPFLDLVRSISAEARNRVDVSKECMVELVPVSLAGTVEVVFPPHGSVDALLAELARIKRQKAELDLRERATIEQLHDRLAEIGVTIPRAVEPRPPLNSPLDKFVRQRGPSTK
jgi:hypothetical protein